MLKKLCSLACVTLALALLCGCGNASDTSGSEATGHYYAGHPFESVKQLLEYLPTQKEDYEMLLHGLPATEKAAEKRFVLVPDCELLKNSTLDGETRPGHIYYTYYLNGFNPNAPLPGGAEEETSVPPITAPGEPTSTPDMDANKIQEMVNSGDYSMLVPSSQEIMNNKSTINFSYDCYGDNGEAGLKYLVESNAGAIFPLEGYPGIYYGECTYLHDDSLFGYMYYWAYGNYNCSAYVPAGLNEQFLKETDGLKTFLHRVYF